LGQQQEEMDASEQPDCLRDFETCTLDTTSACRYNVATV
jgi:hypothetical protein